ncbi:MAG: acyl carrier protein [Cytophagales bacterium]|nr:MAG: acyl carrier protein [Cytophagales bacterium]
MEQELKKILLSMGILETAITANAHLIYDLGLDSLDLTEFMMAVEEKLKITIPSEDQETIIRFGDLVRYAENKAMTVN